VNTNKPSTHDRLRQEAATLFARRGYGGTSMAEIADRVGIRKASLYNYYDSKADLMFELLERSLNDWESACRVEVRPEANVEEKLAAYLAAALQFGRDNPQAIGIIRQAVGQIPRDLRQRVHEIMNRHEELWHQALRELFAEAIDRDEVEAADPDDLVLFWSVFVDGLLMHLIVGTARRWSSRYEETFRDDPCADTVRGCCCVCRVHRRRNG
jgi:AcrR family transcriptional regulator